MATPALAVQSGADITSDESAEEIVTPIEPAVTVITPAHTAMPKAPLLATATQGPGISSVFRLGLSQLAILLSLLEAHHQYQL